MPERTLVYLAPVPWGSPPQRPHHFVRWLFDAGVTRVLWVEPYGTRLPRRQDWRRLSGGHAVDVPRPAGLEVLQVAALPVEPLPVLRTLNERLLFRPVLAEIGRWFDAGACLALGRPSRLALALLQRHPDVPSLYDAMDDFPLFHHGLSRRSLAATERALGERVGQVLASSPSLQDKFRGRNAELVPNACDGAALPEPVPFAERRRELAYLGTLASWFDWPSLIALAKGLPDWRIALRGPRFTGLPAGLPENVHVLPACSHAEGMAWLSGAGIGLIPFVDNALTHSVDPVKYYEYRALGLPVLSTAFGTMAGRGADDGVFHLRAGEDPGRLVAMALALRDEASIGEFRRQHGWANRFGTSAALRRFLGLARHLG